jgi:CelD/BcsL family acetyltransferase involved in cellulose biosynthesis
LMGMGRLIDYAMAQGLQTFDLNATQDWLRHIADSSHMLVNVAAFRPTLRGRIYDVIARGRRGRDAI